MSNTTLNEEKNCPAYFKYEGKVYQCVGNDDNQFWAIIDGESKGFEQSNCIVLQVKKDFNVTHLSFGLPILVNGELCTVDHIKPFDFSSTVKDGFVIVFDSENGILETEESDIIKIFEATPSKELIHEYFDNCSTRPAASIESKELKSAAEVITEQIGIRLDAPKQTPMDKGECIVCMEAYASQLHPSPTPDVEDGKQGGEYCKEDLNTAYVAGVSEGMAASSSFEWGTRRKDISFDDWFKDDFEPTQPSTPVQDGWVAIEDGCKLPVIPPPYKEDGCTITPMEVPILCHQDDSICLDWYNDSGIEWFQLKEYTHWQPLPSPPVNKQD